MEPGLFEHAASRDELLFGELEEDLKALVRRVHQLDCGCALLRFLSNRSRQWLTVEDIAFHLKSDVMCAGTSLQGLVALGLVQVREIIGIPFWALTTSPRERQWVESLCTWRNHWQHILGQLEQAVEGRR